MRTKAKTEEAPAKKARATPGISRQKAQPEQRPGSSKRKGAYLDEQVPHRRYAG